MFDLTNKVALVTGASSGIGRAVAIALAMQGAKVAAAARRIDKLEALVAEIKSRGKTGIAIKMDVTKKDEIASGIAKIVETFGKLDILVNNAGVYEKTPIDNFPETAWDNVLQTNLKAYMMLSQSASQQMAKQSAGRIINIGSVAMGSQGFGIAGGAAYAASKAGVVGLTESLALELAPKNILVNCIAPGLIKSEMTQSAIDDPKALESMLGRIPLKRAGNAEEIASVIVFLASDEASYTTGATIVVDGGWLAG